MTNSNRIILGLLGAAAAGIAIGMLIAPEKGADMRKKIAEKAGDLASHVGDFVSYGKEKLEEVAHTLTTQAEGLAKDAGRRADRIKESIG